MAMAAYSRAPETLPRACMRATSYVCMYMQRTTLLYKMGCAPHNVDKTSSQSRCIYCLTTYAFSCGEGKPHQKYTVQQPLG